MAKMIEVRVITNEGLAIKEEAVSVRAPGEMGSFGVLYNHAPLVSTLQPGQLMWRTPNGRMHHLRVTEGLIEISKNRLTVLTSATSQSGVTGP